MLLPDDGGLQGGGNANIKTKIVTTTATLKTMVTTKKTTTMMAIKTMAETIITTIIATITIVAMRAMMMIKIKMKREKGNLRIYKKTMKRIKWIVNMHDKCNCSGDCGNTLSKGSTLFYQSILYNTIHFHISQHFWETVIDCVDGTGKCNN